MTAPVPGTTTEAGTENAQAAAEAAAAAATSTGGETTQTGAEAPKLNEHGFPENTATADMTADQLTNYWKFHARKHETRANQAPKQEELDAANQRIAELEAAGKSAEQVASEQAIADAVARAKEEARNEVLPILHEAQLRSFAGTVIKDAPKLDAFVRTANIGAFVVDGQIDGSKVVEELSMIFGDPGEIKPPAGGATHHNFGQQAQGPAGSRKSSQRDAGLEAARKRGFIE
nr:hypothetical protein [Rhodococcus sp. (in: high G+C Gram-positive bacteria)]